MATKDEVLIEPITDAKDFLGAFRSCAEGFGRQTKDAVWQSVNPAWDTPKGQEEGAARLQKRWENITKNRDGQPNTVFVKASVPVTGEDGKTERTVAGLAIWQQASFVEGFGDPPSTDVSSTLPENIDPTEKRFATQVFASLFKRRVEYVREKQNDDVPAVFVLDLCAVDPAFQRRGIASKLVQWGLDEAKRRHGGLEATTEASVMGKPVYEKLGFKAEGPGGVVFEVEEEFEKRDKPPNVFLRTRVA